MAKRLNAKLNIKHQIFYPKYTEKNKRCRICVLHCYAGHICLAANLQRAVAIGRCETVPRLDSHAENMWPDELGSRRHGFVGSITEAGIKDL